MKATPVETPHQLVDAVLGTIHDVLGTREGFEKHPGNVTQAERREILSRFRAEVIGDGAGLYTSRPFVPRPQKS
jgi:hypothetical protein